MLLFYIFYVMHLCDILFVAVEVLAMVPQNIMIKYVPM